MYNLSIVLGIIAGTLWLLSFAVKNKKLMLSISFIENIFYALQYIILAVFCNENDAWTVVAIDVINIFRTVLFMYKGKYKWSTGLLLPVSFSIIYIISLTFTYSSYISLFGTIASIVIIMGLWTDKLSSRRLLCLLNIVLWIISDYLMHNYVNLITYTIVLISTLIVTIKELKQGIYFTDDNIITVENKIQVENER